MKKLRSPRSRHVFKKVKSAKFRGAISYELPVGGEGKKLLINNPVHIYSGRTSVGKFCRK